MSGMVKQRRRAYRSSTARSDSPAALSASTSEQCIADGVFVSFIANRTIAACWLLSTDRSSASTPATSFSAAACGRPSSEISSRFRPAAWCPGQ